MSMQAQWLAVHATWSIFANLQNGAWSIGRLTRKHSCVWSQACKGDSDLLEELLLVLTSQVLMASSALKSLQISYFKVNHTVDCPSHRPHTHLLQE